MKNNWIDGNSEQIEFYLNEKDVILIDRALNLETMVRIFESYFDKRDGLDFLDFGCGDGALTKVMHGLYPGNNYHLLDGSPVMLDKARANFKSKEFTFTQATFEDYILKNTDEEKYDFIFSSMAIHHLPHEMKGRLFSKFHTQLKHGGLFINIDVVLPVSRKAEEIQFDMWTSYTNRELKRLGRESEIYKDDELPSMYKAKAENKPSTLSSQLNILEQTGFRDVECYLKHGIFVLFGGYKS